MALLLFIKLTQKDGKKPIIKEVHVSAHANNLRALAHAYCQFHCAYYCKKDKFIFTHDGGSLCYGKGYAIICDNKTAPAIVLYTRQDTQSFKQQLQRIEELAYTDKSLLFSDLHSRYSLPEGYKILGAGETILETDLEYHDERFWFEPSWYNIGKVVSKGGRMTFYHNNKKVSTHTSVNEPLIARKIIN